jgi:hypothetical protein
MLFISCMFLQSAYHPTYALGDTVFITCVNSYIFRRVCKPTCQSRFCSVFMVINFIYVQNFNISVLYVPGGGEIFCTRPDRPWGLPSLLYNGYRVFPGVKRPGRGADHPPPSSAEAKKG